MSSYIISYDLDNPGQNYEKLIDAIKNYGTYAKITESCWCIVSTDESKVIRDNLESIVDSNDKLFVAKLTGQAAWFGLSKSTSDWLHNNL